MKKKTNLDEMQEKQLLHIEHNACWIAFWSLFAAVYIQLAMGHGAIEYIGGESIILLVLAVYICVSCIRHGIWDRKLKPNFRTNLTVSLVAGVAIGIFWGVVSYHRHHALAGSLATGMMMLIIMAGLSFALLSLTSAAYRRRKKQLEDDSDEE